MVCVDDDCDDSDRERERRDEEGKGAVLKDPADDDMVL
jgi:hypothetical protein